MINLELPYPPSVNHYYRKVVRWKRGKPFVCVKLGSKGEMHRKAVSLVCAMNKVRTLKGRLEAQVMLYPPDKRKRDIDNPIKCLLDSMEHGRVYENDNQIDGL